MKFIKNTILITAIAFSAVAAANPEQPDHQGFYLGPSLGYGSTNWEFLTTTENSAASISSPIKAEDTGGVYGAIAGYQINHYFAIEGNYMHYPTSKITFGEFSAYWPDKATKTTITSDTQAIALYLKLMVPFGFFGDTNVYSGIGLEQTFRSDVLDQQHSKTGGIFTGGIIHFFNPHIAVATGFDFLTGSAKAEDEPAHHYIPFLYQGHVMLLYYI